MSRHLADHTRTSDGSRLKRYVEIERATGAEGAHPSAKAAFARPTSRDAAAKVKAFVRIARGDEA